MQPTVTPTASRLVPAWPTLMPDGWYAGLVKPVLDRTAAALGLVVLVPVLAAVALLIALSQGGPVLYRQRRVGRHGVVFTVYKFCTMRSDRRGGAERRGVGARADDGDRRHCHKSPNDPRVTAVGAFLRRSSLDELPQLLNVVLGHMSLVGPRPEMESVVANYAPWQHRRHVVKPGLTGLWQVTRRGSAPLHECTDLDLRYMHALSLRQDLRLLAMTIPAVLGRNQGF